MMIMVAPHGGITGPLIAGSASVANRTSLPCITLGSRRPHSPWVSLWTSLTRIAHWTRRPSLPRRASGTLRSRRALRPLRPHRALRARRPRRPPIVRVGLLDYEVLQFRAFLLELRQYPVNHLVFRIHGLHHRRSPFTCHRLRRSARTQAPSNSKSPPDGSGTASKDENTYGVPSPAVRMST